MRRTAIYEYHIRDLLTGKTARFGDDAYDKMISWAESRGGRRIFRTNGGWLSTGTRGIAFKYWQGYQTLGGGPVNRFIIHRRKIDE